MTFFRSLRFEDKFITFGRLMHENDKNKDLDEFFDEAEQALERIIEICIDIELDETQKMTMIRSVCAVYFSGIEDGKEIN